METERPDAGGEQPTDGGGDVDVNVDTGGGDASVTTDGDVEND